MRVRGVIGLVVGLAGATPAAARAQGRTSSLSGSVTDADGRLLKDATIEVMGTGVQTTTNEAGRYRLSGVPSGQRWILVRHRGYRPSRISATLDDGSRRDFPFELKPLPEGATEATVLSDIGMNRVRFQGFLERSQAAFGTFLTQDDLAGSSVDLIDLARQYLPGRSRLALEKRSTDTGVRSARLLRRTNPRASRSANRLYDGSGCTPAISLNGSPPSIGVSLADFDREQVEALEIYRRGSWSPTEFAYRDGTTGCGLIVVWSR
jgi:hypothetical protein